MLEVLLKSEYLTLVIALATIAGGGPPAVAIIKQLAQLRKVRSLTREAPANQSSQIPIRILGQVSAPQIAYVRAADRTVRFGVMPFIDHTQAFIAQRLGWFAEAGIRSIFREYTPATGLSALELGEIDVLSITPSALIKSGSNPRSIQVFVLHDLFMGYGLMTRRKLTASPPFRIRSYAELCNGGMSHDEALGQIAQALLGRRITHANDDAVFPFLHRILSAAPSSKEVKHIVADEMQTVKNMVKRKADFQIGGVPSRLTLEKLGFRPLITSRELLQSGTLMHNSTEYQGCIQGGWFATKAWLCGNEDLALRMASVSYRVSKFIKDDPRLAASIQAPYLNSIADTCLTPIDIERAYTELHPFFSFEEQDAWFNDESEAFFVHIVTQNIIDHWRSVLPEADFLNLLSSGDIMVADKWHAKLADLQQACAHEFYTQSKSEGSSARMADLRAAAKFFSSYNFVDCLGVLRAISQGSI